ncbi:threonine synthase [Candidatus Woesearchaeota archaeon]|nr:threonine synthase [Candidatus Woesearchaeota archaeon]
MNNLICQHCKKTHPLNEKIWQCTACKGFLKINFKPKFPLNKIKQRKPTLWRYREAIPLDHDKNIVSFAEGFTPLLPITINKKTVFIKQEQLFPTGSFKDRGTTVLMSKIKELGIKQVIEDSSGNAGSSIAAYAAKAGITAHIYVPEHASPGKLVQIQAYSAKLHKIKGSREDTAAVAMKAAEKIFYASHRYNPWFFQGTKTFAFEVTEQLGWKVPDAIILPVGNGSLLLGTYIGFQELLDAHIISKLPKFIAVQAENCSPLYDAFKKNLNTTTKITKKDTLAEGIATADPIRGTELLMIIRETKGTVIIVSEQEIKQAWQDMAKQGYYIEPTSAAGTAGVKKYVSKSKNNEIIVSAFTGHGLKTTSTIQSFFK